MDIEQATVELHRLVANTAKLLKCEADTKRLYFNIEMDVAVPFRLRGDAQSLRHRLLQLVRKAIKFTESGGVTLKVTQLHSVEARVRVRFEVIDTATQFCEVSQEGIFDAVTQDAVVATRPFDINSRATSNGGPPIDPLEENFSLSKCLGVGHDAGSSWICRNSHRWVWFPMP